MDSKRSLSNADYFQNLMREADVPGMSIAIVTDGRPSWNGALGVADTKSKTPVSTTLFLSLHRSANSFCLFSI